MLVSVTNKTYFDTRPDLFSDSRVDMESITDALSWVDNLLDDVHRLADEQPDRTRSTAPATDSSPRSVTASPPSSC